MKNKGFEEAFNVKLKFTRAELKSLGLEELNLKGFIVSNNKYFVPEVISNDIKKQRI